MINRSNSLRQKAFETQQQEIFDRLPDTLKNFIKSSAEGETSLAKLVAGQAVETRAFVNAESHQIKQQLQSWRDEEANQAAGERLLKSLKSENMNLRLNEIVERHNETFEWIFSEDPEAPYTSLPHWLEAGQGIFWISGKAGSGKSTFMKFICEDSRTHKMLETWHEGTIILSFFFWKSGSAVQRSFRGLLTSLLYQLLQKDARISSRLLTHTPSLKQKHANADWSAKEATDILLDALIMAERPVCIFLDGLDEFDEDEDCGKLLDIIDKLTSSKHNVPLKICVSSRPEPEFRRTLERFPKLRLQDLTKHDMEICANDILQGAPIERLPELVQIVLDKADGVFLWVHYALRSLIRGLRQHDDWNELELRLKALPSKIEELYHDMWRRLNEDRVIYREEAARYFHIVMQLESPSIFQVMTASDPLLEENLLERQIPVMAQDLVRQCEKTEERLRTRCAGLLEISAYWDADSEDEERGNDTDTSRNEQENSRPRPRAVPSPLHPLERFAERSVSFLHRTARDFLIDTGAGRDILRYYSPPLADWQTLWLRVELVDMLAGLRIFEWTDAEGQMSRLLDSNLDFSQNDGIGALELMDRVLTRLTTQTPPKSIIGYSNVNFSNPRWVKSGKSTNYHKDFLGLAAYYGMTTYIRRVLDQLHGGIKFRTDYLDYLLLCSSCGLGSVAKRVNLVSLLIDYGANPIVRGFRPINDRVYYIAFSHPTVLLKRIYDIPSNMSKAHVDSTLGLGIDFIKHFLVRGPDLSTKVLKGIRDGKSVNDCAVNLSRLKAPLLVYETTIGDIINSALLHMKYSSVEDLMGAQDYAKTRRTLLVSGKGRLAKARKVSNAEDAALLNDRLATYLPVLCIPSSHNDHGRENRRHRDNKNTPEYIRLAESIIEVEARSEPVDVYETLVQMGYMKPPSYNFSPGELFEEIPVDTVSDRGEAGSSTYREGQESTTKEPRENVDEKEPA